jgi:hypothetical protein
MSTAPCRIGTGLQSGVAIHPMHKPIIGIGIDTNLASCDFFYEANQYGTLAST